ncbi:MAG TPA: OsmC family protein [Candidatus Acidoferrales bacterium]|nr:OsmC family protein [Candidatus Acidoferrales bacterium]
MEPNRKYQIRAKCTKARSGVISSDALSDPITFSAPPEFLGDAGVWTPEHFFVAAVATCFVSTFSGMAELSKLSFVSFETEAEGILEKNASGWRFVEVRLQPTVIVSREQDRERAKRILEKAEKSCLVARSITANVVMNPTVNLEQEVVTPGLS